MLVVNCPKCAKQSNVAETSRGRRIRCAGCQAIFLPFGDSAAVPPPPRAAAPPPLPRRHAPGDEPSEPIDEPAADATPQPFGSEAPPARLGLWIAVVVLGLLMVGGGIFAAMYFKK